MGLAAERILRRNLNSENRENEEERVRHPELARQTASCQRGGHGEHIEGKNVKKSQRQNTDEEKQVKL